MRGPEPECRTIELWNAVHSFALSRIFGAAHVFVKHSADETEYWAPHEGNTWVLALHEKLGKAIRTTDIAGFILGEPGELWRIADFVLLGGKALLDEGRFRFLVIERKNQKKFEISPASE